MGKLDKIKNDVKGVLTQKVRLGFINVPVWLLAAGFIVQQVRRRRQSAAY